MCHPYRAHLGPVVVSCDVRLPCSLPRVVVMLNSGFIFARDSFDGPVAEAESGEELRLGGMALQNGVMLHSPNYWAAAVRREEDGRLEVFSDRKKISFSQGRLTQVPLVRGLARLAEAMAILPDVRSRLGGAVLPTEVPTVVAAMVASTLAAVGLRRRESGSVVKQEMGIAVLMLVPAMIALRHSPLARYHGAEHVSIGEYEVSLSGDGDLTESGPAQATREHDRCGSNLLGPMLATSVLGNVIMRSITRRPSPVFTLTVGVLSIGSAVEIFQWMTRNPGSALARLLSRPGYCLQHYFTTEQPTSEQLEVGRAALAEILRLEGSRD